MNNLNYWEKLRSVPSEALKKIQAGRLKGKSDINPQWRYKVLTETFGPCGVGWKFTIEKQWLETYNTGEIAAFANINFYFKHDENWSEPIPANGGSMFVSKERNGPYLSDECYKMAITDALGTAMKMIGVASDVYSGFMDSKYSKPNQSQEENQLPWLNKGEQLNKAISYLKTGGSISEIEKKYRISKEIRSNLNQAIKGL